MAKFDDSAPRKRRRSLRLLPSKTKHENKPHQRVARRELGQGAGEGNAQQRRYEQETVGREAEGAARLAPRGRDGGEGEAVDLVVCVVVWVSCCDGGLGTISIRRVGASHSINHQPPRQPTITQDTQAVDSTHRLLQGLPHGRARVGPFHLLEQPVQLPFLAPLIPIPLCGQPRDAANGSSPGVLGVGVGGVGRGVWCVGCLFIYDRGV